MEYSKNIHRTKKKKKKKQYVSDSFVRWMHPAALQSEETAGEFFRLDRTRPPVVEHVQK